jgi:hypothetical protein
MILRNPYATASRTFPVEPTTIVITFSPAGFTTTWPAYESDPESEDPRVNVALPFGLHA